MRETTAGTTTFARPGWSRRWRALASLGVTALALGSATTSALVPVTQAAAATGVNVFVGYADNARVPVANFPNPWAGSPNVTFDGCTTAACLASGFDAGAVRVENDTSSSVVVNQVDVHIDTCHYTWAGPLYPVTLAPGQSLITTERVTAVAGCTGPTPDSIDSSDIGLGGIAYSGCTNDKILPTVDVTLSGTITSSTDTGQIINTGGIDPAVCTGASESTQWVLIGSVPCPGPLSLSLAPSSQTQSVGTTATATATFTNSCGDALSGALVNFNVISGPNTGLTGSTTTDASGNASFSYSSSLPGTDTLQASVTNATGATTTSNTVTVTWTLAFAPGGGSFVIGNQNSAPGTSVTFWGAQWAKDNSLSGGSAPRSFKGFAENPTTPSCGADWTADPGNSTPPPDGPLPAFMGVIVTSSADQSGSTIAGNTVHIVIVKTDSGYQPNAGHAGTGTVVAVVC
jgi:Bacterial Ig-like domain (group 1)